MKAHIFSTLFHTRAFRYHRIIITVSLTLKVASKRREEEEEDNLLLLLRYRRPLLLLYCDTIKKVESKIRRNIGRRHFSRDASILFPRQTRECAPNGRRRRRRRLAVFYFFERALFEARLRSASIRSLLRGS